MAYSNQKKDAVIELINKYTGDTLDNYIKDSVIKIAKESMDANKTNTEVADAVFDYINNNHSGNETMATACRFICPKSVLYILRNEIISALK